MIDHPGDGIRFVVKTVEESGIDHFSVAGIRSFFYIAALHDFDYIDSELACELVISLVVSRDRHYRAGSVAHHNVIGNKDRYIAARYGIARRDARELYAGLVLVYLRALEFGLFSARLAVLLDLAEVCYLFFVFVEDRMLRRHYHKRHAEKRVGPRRVYRKFFVGSVEGKIDESSARFADPVDLLRLDVGGIVDVLETLEKLVCVFGYAEIPDVLRFLNDVTLADIALAALTVLVGKNDLAARAVVDERLVAENETVLEHLQEDPLRPFVVTLVRRIYSA